MSAFLSRFQNGRTATKSRAIWVGSNAVHCARQNHGGKKMVSNARRVRGPKSGPGPFSGPIMEENLNLRFSATIIDFSPKQLANIANCGVDTAKAWKKGRQIPQMEHVLRLARKIQKVRAFLHHESDPALDTPRATNALLLGLQQVAAQSGPDGEAARALLRKIHASDDHA